jgi:class 3 adenylate cyclase
VILLFAVLFLPLSAGLVAASILLHRGAANQRIAVARAEERHAIEMQRDALEARLRATISDLTFLRELNELKAFLAPSGSRERLALERELIAFSRSREVYDQIRVLSPDGMELARVNRAEGSTEAVPPSALQYKGGRYYFERMVRCRAGAVYVSPLDLNVENGELERPLNPVLRIGTALGGTQRSGYLILNLRGMELLDAFTNAHPAPRSTGFLVDANGYWLRGPRRSVEWGSSLPERAGHGFRLSFADEWRRLATSSDGQFESEQGLFTFDTFLPNDLTDGAGCDAYPERGWLGEPPGVASIAWKNISWIPPQQLRALRIQGAGSLAGWLAVAVSALGGGCWVLSVRIGRWRDSHRRTVKEKGLLESTLAKYMPTTVTQRLLADPARHGALGGESQSVAVLFADVRGFTCFAEEQDPQHVVAVLNRVMTRIVKPIAQYEGILDKFIGDGFLVYFEPARGMSDAARRAVRAAQRMQEAFSDLQTEEEDPAVRALGLGIGISTGRVVVGNIGSADAMDYTVVGDPVNVASRLQSLARHGEILISEHVCEHLGDDLCADVMPSTALRGRVQRIDIYRIRPADSTRSTGSAFS